jgi:hypothetical protein
VNALIPALVAVLLSELGGPLLILGRERRTGTALALASLVALAVVGGSATAALLAPHARTLLLGLALMIAAGSQWGNRKFPGGKPTMIASAMTLYRSPTPFLAFALTAWTNAPLTAFAGVMAGLGIIAGVASLGVAIPRAARIGAGAIMGLAGIFAALSGLRLL